MAILSQSIGKSTVQGCMLNQRTVRPKQRDGKQKTGPVEQRIDLGFEEESFANNLHENVANHWHRKLCLTLHRKVFCNAFTKNFFARPLRENIENPST